MQHKPTLCEKISGDYPRQPKALKSNNRRCVIVRDANMSEDFAVKEATFHLRTIIMEMQKIQQDLPHPTTIETLIFGQGKRHNELLYVFRVLYTGSISPHPTTRLNDS
jgi:hypothetical protein